MQHQFDYHQTFFIFLNIQTQSDNKSINFLMFCFFLKLVTSILFLQLAFSYSNKTILHYNYGSTDICDPADPWNQSAFGGIEHPLYIQILENAGWNLSEIAFYCMFSDGQIYKAYNNPEYFDCYLGTLSAWITTPITYPFQTSQPMHEIIFEAVASYDAPSWIIFQQFDFRILMILFATPFVIAIFLHFLNEKQSRYYQISDYIGLIFFQQEITGRRNLSTKIISLAIQIVSLITMSIFTYKLQESFNDMRTYGGRTIENGLQGVHIYTNEFNIYRTMASTLLLPISNGALYLSPDQWIDFIANHRGCTFLMEIQTASIFSYRDCSIKLIGDIFYVANVMYFGHETRQEKSQLNAAVVDTMEFRHDYYPEYNISDILDDDEIKCRINDKFIFQYGINDFYQLWVIYAVGVIVGTFGKIINYLRFFKNKRDLGVLENRTNKICKRMVNIFEQSIFWLQLYQMYFTYFPSINKIRIIRKHLINKHPDWMQKLRAARSKVVLHHLRNSKRKFWLKSLIQVFINLTKTSKFRKKFHRAHNKLRFNKIFKIAQAKTSLPTNKRYMSRIVKTALKESLLSTLKTLRICQINVPTKLKEYTHSTGFHKQQLISFKNEHVSKYPICASLHLKLKMLFQDKIICNILQYAKIRHNLGTKKITQHQQQLKKLVKSNIKKNPGELYYRVITAVKYIVRDRKPTKKLGMSLQLANSVPVFKVKNELFIKQLN